MPVVRVAVPHHYDPDDIVRHSQVHIEKMIDDFDGHDLDLEWTGRTAQFQFKSLAFKIKGHIVVDDHEIAVDLDLPLMAMMFKDRIEKAIETNLTQAIADAAS